MTPRTFVVLVEDVPGVLDRVASLFRRRAFNIQSLAVGPTDRTGISHITIVMQADDRTARLVEANLYKLLNVIEVRDVSTQPAVARDLALIKVRAERVVRPEVLQIAEVFGARIVDVSPESEAGAARNGGSRRTTRAAPGSIADERRSRIT